MDIGQAYLAVALDNFREIKRMGERVLAQLNDEEINVIPADESNSIAKSSNIWSATCDHGGLIF
jgi:hypothetical protein